MLGTSRLSSRSLLVLTLCGAALLVRPAAAEEVAKALTEYRFDPHRFALAERFSGKDNYYQVVEDGAEPFIRGRYRPPFDSATLGIQVPDELRQSARRLRWKWRPMLLPAGADECVPGKGDAAAAVYATWKRGLKWYTLKYVWNTLGEKGMSCDRSGNLFGEQETVVLQVGGPVGRWTDQEIDLAAEFRAHFGGDDVPDFVGIGLMTDGDQMNSPAIGDYAAFVLLH